MLMKVQSSLNTHVSGGNSTLEKIWQVLRKLNLQVGIHPTDVKICIYKNLHMNVDSNFIHKC